MMFAAFGALRQRRNLHVSRFRQRSILLLDDHMNVYARHAPTGVLALSYKPRHWQGCRVLRSCLLVGDDGAQRALLVCGTKRAMLITMPCSAPSGGQELSLLRLLHDEMIPIQQMMDSLTMLSSVLSDAPPALMLKTGQPMRALVSGLQSTLTTLRNLSDSACMMLERRALHKCRCDMVERVRWACACGMSSALTKGISLKFHSEHAYLYAMVDPSMIDRIVHNLLSNAFEHTRHGGLVTVKLDRTDDGYVLLVVSDDGEGIPPEIMGRVFEKFVASRGDTDANRGLGLNNVKIMVALHDGEARCLSTRGEGTSIEIKLPLLRLWKRHSGAFQKKTPEIRPCEGLESSAM